MIFKTPQDAIDACNKDCEQAWVHHLKSTINPGKGLDPNEPGYKVAKSFFGAGYMAGAAFVSSLVAKKIKTAAAEEPTKPESKST